MYALHCLNNFYTCQGVYINFKQLLQFQTTIIEVVYEAKVFRNLGLAGCKYL